MDIYWGNNELHSIAVDDKSYRYKAIMGENDLTLYFSTVDFIEIPVGAYTNFDGEIYTLLKSQNFKMISTRNFEYILIMNSAQSTLKKYKFKDQLSGRLKFSLTAKPEQHLQMIIDNLNSREIYAPWGLASFPDLTEKTISYNHNTCEEALKIITDAFETEWRINNKNIYVGKVEFFREDPLVLSYGRGNGFKPGIGRSNIDDSNPIEVLYVQGGERNIDKSVYGSSELKLPISKQIEYQGRLYQTDETGSFITRADKPLSTHEEGSKDLSNIYPSRIGNVSQVIPVDTANNLYDFVDDSIPGALDFEVCRIAGQVMTVIFQSGMLAGREFDISQYIHTERRFEIVPQELDGVMMPGGVWVPAPNDKYAVFGINMPPAYISDDATQTGASWDMFREGVKYLYENEDKRFSFTGELDGIWSEQNWDAIGVKLIPGGTVLFTNNQFQPEGIAIRIVGIKQFINDYKSPVIELSNKPIEKTVNDDLRKIGSNDASVDNKLKSAKLSVNRQFNSLVNNITEITESVSSGRITNISSRTVNVSFTKPFTAIPSGWIRVYRMKLVSVGKWKQYDVMYYHTTENWKTMDGFSLQIDASEALAGIVIEYEFK